MFYLKKLTCFVLLQRAIVSLVNIIKKEESGIFKPETSDIGKKKNPDTDKTNDLGMVKKNHKFSGGRLGFGEKNVDNFLLNLFKEVSVEQRWQSDELSDLKSATKEMVNRIISEAVSPYMDEYKSDGLTQVIFSEAGSMADGTSIIDPDEFDFTMAFVYSSDTIAARPSSNLREFSLSTFQVKPKDPRFKQIFLNNKPMITKQFVQRNFVRLEDAIAKVRANGPVKRGDKSLYLCASDEYGTYYGMQGPSFHLHNLLRWRAPNRKTDFLLSIDLVPAIQLNDSTLAENIHLFKQECPCEEHNLSRPKHCLLMPLKCKYFFTSKVFPHLDEGDQNYWKDKLNFLKSNFMVSFSGYETDLLKKWKCEKSKYHNWYICYTLMKCFGTLDHDSNTTLTFLGNKEQLRLNDEFTFPERTETFSSYSWKNLVFTKAMKECGKYLSLSQCFNSLTSEFEEEHLKDLQKSQELIEIESFCLPSEIAEKVVIREIDSGYTPYVESMKRLKSMINVIKDDPNYSYVKYKKRLVEIFPELSPHLK